MAKSLGVKPEKYLLASAIRKGGVYLSQEHRAYLVDSIWDSGISYRLVRKNGGTSKTAHKGIYGVSVFFIEEVKMPILKVSLLPIKDQELWSQAGRLFYKEGKEMFTLHRRESMSPTAADLFCRKLVKLLNIMELK